ncbi:MAG: hypothetical protein PHU61_00310 [Candidatus Absconditabacteria bacterium]|nr:hypothetical protein [Candidatus Absconditabacteria bacterium]MDD3868629.1 hypothetical protein [Candidatus Absconditabacteria bacterium]MDD4714149.1 hypothetical protein [Candidatus Absconditabacteria bacterium]
MKLQEYFTQQQKNHLSDQQKLDIFSHIQQRKEEKTLSTERFFFVQKKVGYSLLASFIILVVFGGYFLERHDVIDNMFFYAQNGLPEGVYAGEVAQVMEFEGDWYIEKGGQSIRPDFIENGDIVHLKNGSEIIFNINNESQTKIVGPAIFSITKDTEENYKIDLFKGNFIEMYNQKTLCNIEIQTEELNLFQEKNQTIDFQLVKEDGEVMIQNKGDELKVTTSKNNQTIEKIINKEEIVSIKGNDINYIQDTETFNTFLAKNNISETTSIIKPINTPEEEIIINENILPEIALVIDLPQINNNNNPSEIDTGIANDLGVNGEKKVPSKEQTDAINQNLNNFFLQNNIEKIFKDYLQESVSLNNSIQELSNKLNALSKVFNSDIKVNTSLESIASQSLNLKKELENNYYLSPNSLAQLEKITNRANYIQTLEKGLTIEEAQNKWEEIIQSLPNNLLFQ